MKLVALALVAGVLVALFGTSMQHDPHRAPTPPTPAGAKVLYLAGGCFWCLDGMYRQLQGVLQVESGYAGGSRAGVTYEQVCSGATGHAETVRITYDPKLVSEEDLLRIFFTVHNPTTLNRQGNDEGTQYRSAIFTTNDEEKRLAEKVRDEVARAKIWDDPIVTSIEPLRNYTRAEDYHQDYFTKFEKASEAERRSMNAGYCSAVVAPKVIHFREMYAKRLKKQ